MSIANIKIQIFNNKIPFFNIIKHQLEQQNPDVQTKRLKRLHIADQPNTQIPRLKTQLLLMKQTGKHIYTKETKTTLKAHLQGKRKQNKNANHSPLSRLTQTQSSQPPTNYSNYQTRRASRASTSAVHYTHNTIMQRHNTPHSHHSCKYQTPPINTQSKPVQPPKLHIPPCSQLNNNRHNSTPT